MQRGAEPCLGEAGHDERREGVVAEQGDLAARPGDAGLREQPDAERAEEGEDADVRMALVDGGDADAALAAGGEVEVGAAELPGLEHQADDRTAREELDHRPGDRAQVAGVGEDVAAGEILVVEAFHDLDPVGDPRRLRQAERRLGGVAGRAVPPGVAGQGDDPPGPREGGDRRGAGVGAGRGFGHDREAGEIELQGVDAGLDAGEHQAGSGILLGSRRGPHRA